MENTALIPENIPQTSYEGTKSRLRRKRRGEVRGGR
jgi:hypothetical protein